MAALLGQPVDLLSIFRSGQADGMILMEILTHDRRVELLQQNKFPFVMIGRCSDNTGLSYVDVDITKGIAIGFPSLETYAPRQHQEIILPCEIIERTSTGPLKAE